MSSSPTPASTRLATGCANRGLAAPHRARWQSLRARNYLMLDALWVLALVGVVAEWLALGWLTGVAGQAGSTGARWALRLLVGAFLIGLTQLLLALVGGWLRQRPAGPVRRGRVCGRAAPDGRAKCGIAADADRYARARWLGRARRGTRRGGAQGVRCSRGWLGRSSHWGLKAQAYALQGSIVDTRTTHEYYPPLVPLLEAWLYLHRGAVSIDAGKTVWPGHRGGLWCVHGLASPGVPRGWRPCRDGHRAQQHAAAGKLLDWPGRSGADGVPQPGHAGRLQYLRSPTAPGSCTWRSARPRP